MMAFLSSLMNSTSELVLSSGSFSIMHVFIAIFEFTLGLLTTLHSD